MMKLQKDLSSYTIDILDIFEIFPLFKPLSEIFSILRFGAMRNGDAYIPMNAEIQDKISKKNPKLITSFTVQLFSNIEQTNAMMKFMESDNIEKYNIGNILLWDDKYIIVGTPFNYSL